MLICAYYLVVWLLFPELPWREILAALVTGLGVGYPAYKWCKHTPESHPMHVLVQFVLFCACLVMLLAPIVAVVRMYLQ